MKNNVKDLHNLLITTAVVNNGLTKTADLSEVVSFIKNYIGQTFEGDKTANITNLLGPAILKMLGFGTFGMLMSVGRLVGLDIGKLVSNLVSSISSKIKGDSISSSDIDSSISQAVDSAYGDSTLPTVENSIKNVNHIKLASINIKNAGVKDILKAKHKLTITSVLSTIVRLLLTAFGIKLGTDMFAKVLGLHNDIDTATEKAKTDKQEEVIQSKFKSDPSYKPESKKDLWELPITPNQFPQTLLEWTTSLYPALKGRESEIFNSPAFRAITDEVRFENRLSNQNIVIMPEKYPTKKSIVDQVVKDLPANK